MAKEYYISTNSLDRSVTFSPRGRNVATQAVSSSLDKLSSKVESFSRIKSAYPYIVRTFVVAAIFGLLVGTYNVDETSGTFNAAAGNAVEQTVPVLDDVTEREVSILVAQLADIIETDEAQAAANASGNTVAFQPETPLVVKNQIVATDAKTRADITTHTVVEGESLADIAKQYNVTTDTIKWANDLNGTVVATGKKLIILPVDGLLHTVTEGDTAQALADRYNANQDKIVAFNDAEINGLVVGEKIVIPGGTKPAPATTTNRLYNAYVARAAVQNYGYVASGYTYLMRSTASHEGYYGGWCTAWASRRAKELGNDVDSGWGNAISWDTSAAAAGFYVGGAPKVGAVFQSDRGSQGHVGVVEEVSSDGTMIKYSDMNGLAGWGNAAKTTGWVPATHYDYIYR